jgi:hypothetical protein
MEKESRQAIANNYDLARGITVLPRPKEIPHVSYILFMSRSLQASYAEEDRIRNI